MIWRFTVFSCQKLESVDLSKIVLESFLDSYNFDCFTKNVKSKQCLGCLAVEKIYVAGYSSWSYYPCSVIA